MSRGAVWAGVFALAAVLALDGCISRRPEPTPVDWAQRRERLLSLDSWQAQGRIAVKAEGRGGQGDLSWEQQGAESRVRVSGPFGAGAYEIRWDPETLSITSRNGEYSRSYAGADSAEQFLAEHLGWSFPAASARFWLLGVPDPGSPSEQRFTPDGRLEAIEQNGWSVTYSRFVEQSGMPMPAKIAIEGVRARLRLVLDHWDF